jgi:hypothetical protein
MTVREYRSSAARIRTHVPRDGFFFSNLERRGIEATWLHCEGYLSWNALKIAHLYTIKWSAWQLQVVGTAFYAMRSLNQHALFSITLKQICLYSTVSLFIHSFVFHLLSLLLFIFLSVSFLHCFPVYFSISFLSFIALLPFDLCLSFLAFFIPSSFSFLA